jgi:hypothetical protein
MYIVDSNNVITRISDSKVIVRDITTKDYRDFMFVQSYRANPDVATVLAAESQIQYPHYTPKKSK